MTVEHIFELVVLIFSVVVHEVSHGLMAYRLGDPTAKLLGRLSMNPLRHLDPVGSVLVPGFLLLMNSGVVFGWAKPVPFDPRNLKNPIRDGALVALAGPLSNMALAAIFGILFRLAVYFGPSLALPVGLPRLFALVVLLNVSLAIFNLIPIAPLDGSKILYALLPRGSESFIAQFEAYGFIVLILVLFSGVLNFLAPIIQFVAGLMLGGM